MSFTPWPGDGCHAENPSWESPRPPWKVHTRAFAVVAPAPACLFVCFDLLLPWLGGSAAVGLHQLEMCGAQLMMVILG